MYVGSGSAGIATYDAVCSISRCPCLLQGMRRSLCVRLSVCLSVSLSLCVSLSLSVCLVCLSVCVCVSADLWSIETFAAECLYGGLIIRAALTE